MRTTFLGLKNSFQVWLDGGWKEVSPYTERETIEFPPPYGKTGVYWFDMPEAYTFAESFKVKNVITKFGSIPDFYNHLTWITAHVFPRSWVETPKGIEFFSNVSYNMTKVTDKFTGVSVAIKAQITGQKDGKQVIYQATMVHPHTSIAAGAGTGSVAAYVLEGKINQPGIHPVEQVLPTSLFEQSMKQRGIIINESWS
jgi:saccharopine dehydrogenase-like NADP-dependent oxidoreductase